MKKNKTIGIHFLSDEPLKADEIHNAKFGHEGIAETLKKIIMICPTPFTIGLFGRWGTGKTTIINILCGKLEQEKIGMVKFDAWKHEGDAFRRTFLKEIVKQLKKKGFLRENYELSVNIDNKVIKKEENQIKFISKIRLGILILLLVIGFILGLIIHLYWSEYLGNYFSIFFSGSLIGSIFFWAFQQMIITRKETTRSVTDRFMDPHQFEEEFKTIIHEIKVKKLILIIDNLDRATHKKAIELLSTIKTFLELKKCIFIIACDDEAIKTHLGEVYKNSTEIENKFFSYSDEFLRKFFNNFIRIPEFIDSDLEIYTEELLKTTGIEKLNNRKITTVITAAFRENPRQIKQFINTLISHYLLAKEREECTPKLISEKGTITNNLDLLAKILIIRQNFPCVYNKIEKEKMDSDEIFKKGVTKEAKDFLISTRLIPEIKIENVKPFLYFKISELETKIPDVEELKIAMLNNKIEIVSNKFIKASKLPEMWENYENYIISQLKERKYFQQHLFNIVSSSIKSLDQNNLSFNTSRYYNEVAYLLGLSLKNQIHIFSPSFIFRQIVNQCNKHYIPNIISQYIKILQDQGNETKNYILNDGWIFDLFQNIVKKPNLFNTKKEEITKLLKDLYHKNINIMSLFIEKELQINFITEDVISNFISTIHNDDIEEKNSLNEKVNLIIDFKNICTPTILDKLLHKYADLLNYENPKPFRDEKVNLINNIEIIFTNFSEILKLRARLT